MYQNIKNTLDMASINKVYVNENEKLAVVVGTGIPTQIIQNFEYEGWDTINDFDDEPLFDMNAWCEAIPKTCPTDTQEYHRGVQYCGLVKLEKPIITEFPEIGKTHVQTHRMDDDYQNPNEVILTEDVVITGQPITLLLAELIAQQKKI